MTIIYIMNHLMKTPTDRDQRDRDRAHAQTTTLALSPERAQAHDARTPTRDRQHIYPARKRLTCAIRFRQRPASPLHNRTHRCPRAASLGRGSSQLRLVSHSAA